jgi:hypothetical protein
MSIYHSGKIYKLLDIDSHEILYIGSTTIKLPQTLADLKYNYHHNLSSSKYEHMFEHV